MMHHLRAKSNKRVRHQSRTKQYSCVNRIREATRQIPVFRWSWTESTVIRGWYSNSHKDAWIVTLNAVFRNASAWLVMTLRYAVAITEFEFIVLDENTWLIMNEAWGNQHNFRAKRIKYERLFASERNLRISRECRHFSTLSWDGLSANLYIDAFRN